MNILKTDTIQLRSSSDVIFFKSSKFPICGNLHFSIWEKLDLYLLQPLRKSHQSGGVTDFPLS